MRPARLFSRRRHLCSRFVGLAVEWGYCFRLRLGRTQPALRCSITLPLDPTKGGVRALLISCRRLFFLRPAPAIELPTSPSCWARREKG